jgi:histidinol-phosphate/aromatic aminotransferase/cobyric acid decarboxylase-like protein
MDGIDALIAAYRRRHGRDPVNVSHWDPSREFVQNLKDALPINALPDPVPYRYSYLIEARSEVLKGLGVSSTSASGLFTENGSMSITAVANWLSAIGIRDVRLLCPTYFITAHNLRRLGIIVSEVPVERYEGRYVLPREVKLDPKQALWLTNPVYNTGDYSIERDIERIAAIIDEGNVVIADEALAFAPTKMARVLGGRRNFVGIYTPHKALCINGLKFSLVTFHPEVEDFFDDWGDVLFGGLSISAVAAIGHFLSPKFDTYRKEFVRAIDSVRGWHHDLVGRYIGRIETDRYSQGHFLTVYFPGLAAALGTSLPFIEAAIETTGAAFIPGNRSGFDPKLGFCFRVNLAQDSGRFRSALSRLYGHLAR